MALNFGPQSSSFEFARGPQQRPAPSNPLRPVTWILVAVGAAYLVFHGWIDSQRGSNGRDAVQAAPDDGAPPPETPPDAPPAGGGTGEPPAPGDTTPPGDAPPPPPGGTGRTIAFGGALENVKDFTKWEQDEAYHTLLHFIKGIPARDLLARIQPELGFNQMFRQPSRCRGQIVQIEGTILDVYPFRLDPNPDGIKDIYEGHLVDAPNNTAYVFHVLERPPKPVEREDEGRVVGVFLKVHQYVTQADQTQNLPFVIGKRLEIRGGQTFGPAAKYFHWVIGGAVAVVVLVLLIVIAFTRRSERLYDDRLKEARHRATTRASAAPPGPPAAGGLPPFPGLPPAPPTAPVTSDFPPFPGLPPAPPPPGPA